MKNIPITQCFHCYAELYWAADYWCHTHHGRTETKHLTTAINLRYAGVLHWDCLQDFWSLVGMITRFFVTSRSLSDYFRWPLWPFFLAFPDLLVNIVNVSELCRKLLQSRGAFGLVILQNILTWLYLYKSLISGSLEYQRWLLKKIFYNHL